ncbi:MAG: hypothetical protein CMJ64_22555 [Planctomycetaceae bacterium]|nr:hypothetical protein [Planctomycetaceae bacterium]
MASEWKPGEGEADVSKWLGDSEAALVAETSDGKEFLVAVAYPRDLLLQLAEDLAPRLEAETMVASEVIARDPLKTLEERPSAKSIEVVEGPPAEQDDVLCPSQPADSIATIERRPYGITIDIPPAGIWKGSRGLTFFAVIWNGFLSIFITVIVLSMTGAIEVEGDKPGWLMLLFMIPFLAVGVGVALAAINMGRRHATIATADDLVMVVRHSIFGKKTHEWSADKIDEIKVGPSGMEVNDVPVMELQIHSRSHKKFGCLSQLDQDELAWISGELNQALTIRRPDSAVVRAAKYSERDNSGRVLPAPGSRVTVQHSIDGTHIHVPSQGIVSNLGGILIGLLFMLIAVGVVVFVGKQEFKNGIAGGEWFTLVFIALWATLFGGGGAFAFFGSLVGGRRRFEITPDSHQLTVVRRGLFGWRTFRWDRDVLEPIAVADSGMKVNNRTYYQVSIRSQKDDSLGIMSGHDRGDLAFVAATINETLGLMKEKTVPI